MPSLQVTRTSTKSPDALWEVIADFPNIANWNSGVKTSVATSADTGGVGATRHCELSPAGALDERVLEWEEGSRVKIAVDKASKAPIKHATANFSITPEGDHVRLDIEYEFEPKGGVAGRAAAPAFKKAFTRAFSSFLDEWDEAAT
jgi:ribosome-associated toxin RatA of RatAB toxin-antitoxin module